MSVQAVAVLGSWTRQQGGMVTTAQAASVGVSRVTLHVLVRAGVLSRMRYGVYRFTGVPWSRNDEIRAAWLQVEPGPMAPSERRAAVSRQTAASVYGFGDMEPPAIQITLPEPRRTQQADLRCYVGRLDADEVEWVDDIRVTRPARIIDDLLDDGYGDLEHLGSIAVDAVAAHRLTPAALVDVCGPYAARYGLPAGDGNALARLVWESYAGQDLAAA